MNIVMRGHGPGALCEICDTRPGVRMANFDGCEAWSCYRCMGIDPADYGEDDNGKPLETEQCA